ncbi:MAG: hypothetical protein QXT83_04760, partial [Sulfolobales archaeon]
GEVLSGLTKIGVLENPDKEVLFTESWVQEYGYPVHTVKSNTARNELLRVVVEEGIITLGRWGSWRYLNMDKVYEQVITSLKTL